MNIAEAKHIVGKDKDKRVETVRTEITKILEANRCELIAVPFITEEGKLDARFVIKALD